MFYRCKASERDQNSHWEAHCLVTSSEQPRIRIAYFITSLEVGGSERQLVSWLRGLSPERYERHLICLSGFGPLENEARATGAVLHDLRYPRLKAAGTIQWQNIPAAALTLVRLVRLLREIQPHVLHTMIPVCNVLGAIAGKIAGVPRMACTKLALGAYRDKARLLPKIEDVTDRWFHLIHCKSRGILEDIARRQPIPRERMRVIYNGISVSRFDIVCDRERVREELNIPQDAFVIGMVANLIPYKGHREAIEAFAQLHAKHGNIRLLLVGRDDGIGDELRALAEELRVGEKVIFTGPRSDIPQVMIAMDVLLSASHEEGFSNVLLEAMASRLPIVATRVGGNPEAVVDGETGFLVDVKAPEQIAKAFSTLIENPNLARRMGQAGRERVERESSYEAMMQGLERFYEELLQDIDLSRHAQA